MTIFAPEISDFFAPSKGSSPEEIGFLLGHEITPLESDGVTKEVFQFLMQINAEQKEIEIVWNAIDLSAEGIFDIDEAFVEMEKMLQVAAEDECVSKIEKKEEPLARECKEKAPPSEVKKSDLPPLHKSALPHPMELQAAFVKKMNHYDSAKAPFFSSPLSTEKEQVRERETTKEKERAMPSLFTISSSKETSFGHTKNREQKEGREQEQQQEQQREDQEEKERKKHPFFSKKKERDSVITAISMDASQQSIDEKKEDENRITLLPQITDIFNSFMALMARILGQAQADAHTLYQRIKERTDNVDTLTTLLGKLNNNAKKIDWTKDEAMKALVDKARAIGVEIPEGKYSWNEDEKRALRDNIQMRKDTLEKVTQMERTDMQRFMQEASQCHQARSNVLKLMKEIGDTIISNLRGH